MKRHAVLIMNDTFPQSNKKLDVLTTVQDDLQAMERVLGDFRSPPVSIVARLVNKTALEIDDALNVVMESVDPDNDLLIVYYAGHGRVLKRANAADSLLLATYSSRPEADDRYCDYEFRLIEKKLSNRNIQRAVIILDCCYSGLAGDQEFRGGDTQTVLTPFTSSDYSLVTPDAKNAFKPASPNEIGDGVYILTACDRNQRASGSTVTRSGQFTGKLVTALEEACKNSLDAIVLQDIYSNVRSAMGKLDQNPMLFKRWGECPYLVIAPQGVHGVTEKRSLCNWTPPPKDRMTRLNSLSPMYLLDSGFRFLHWNSLFEDIVARQLGLVVGCHALEFVDRLSNVLAVSKRRPYVFPTPTDAESALAEQTGEIWPGFPLVDIERLDFQSDQFGLIVFDKLALQIKEPGFHRPTTWQVELNARFIQDADGYWENARRVNDLEQLWTTYAETYDAVVEAYPPYRKLIEKVVGHVEGNSRCLEIGAATGNTTIALLNQADRQVTTIEASDAMLEQLIEKLGDDRRRVKVLKGDAITVVRRIYAERTAANQSPELYDCCVMMNVLFAFSNRERLECLQAIYRVLQPGAVLSISTPQMSAPVETLMQNIRRWHRENHPQSLIVTNELAWEAAVGINERLGRLAKESRIDRTTLSQLLKQCQFKIIEESICEDYDECVLVVKAVKPGLVPVIEKQQPIEVTTVTSTVKDSKKEPKAEEEEETDKRPFIKIFVSYSTKDSPIVKSLLEKLREYLGASKGFRYEFWKDNENVLLGEKWDLEIQEAIDQCDFGLLLVSPNFLGSEYVARKELSKFCKLQLKPILPVLLKEIDMVNMNVRGLEDWQIFALQDDKRSAYTACYGGRKEQFVRRLFSEIESRIRKHSDG